MTRTTVLKQENRRRSGVGCERHPRFAEGARRNKYTFWSGLYPAIDARSIHAWYISEWRLFLTSDPPQTIRQMTRAVGQLSRRRAGFESMGITAPALSDGYLGCEWLLKWEQAGKLVCRVVGVHGTRDASGDPVEQLAVREEWKYEISVGARPGHRPLDLGRWDFFSHTGETRTYEHPDDRNRCEPSPRAQPDQAPNCR